MRADLTLLIVARNAAATIERALLSCVTEPGCPIVLVDDFSRDDTVARARSIAGSRLHVLTSPPPGGVGLARQCALDAVETEYAAWLDADDEWIAGRRSPRADAGGRRRHRHREHRSLRWRDLPVATSPHRALVRPVSRRRTAALRAQLPPGDTQVAFRTHVFRDAGGLIRRFEAPRVSICCCEPFTVALDSRPVMRLDTGCMRIRAACRGTWIGNVQR